MIGEAPAFKEAPAGATGEPMDEELAPTGRQSTWTDIRPFVEADEPQIVDLWERCGLAAAWNDPHKDIARKLTRSARAVPGGRRGDRGDRDRGHRDGGLRGPPRLDQLPGGASHWPPARIRARADGGRRGSVARSRVRQDQPPDPARATGEAIAFYRGIGFVEDAVVSMGKRLERDDGEPRAPDQTVSQRPLVADRRSASSTAMFLIDSSSGIGAGPPVAAARANSCARIVYWFTGPKFDALGRRAPRGARWSREPARRPVVRGVPGVHRVDVALAAEQLRALLRRELHAAGEDRVPARKPEDGAGHDVHAGVRRRAPCGRSPRSARRRSRSGSW